MHCCGNIESVETSGLQIQQLCFVHAKKKYSVLMCSYSLSVKMLWEQGVDAVCRMDLAK